jgi:hypothetical protein
LGCIALHRIALHYIVVAVDSLPFACMWVCVCEWWRDQRLLRMTRLLRVVRSFRAIRTLKLMTRLTRFATAATAFVKLIPVMFDWGRVIALLTYTFAVAGVGEFSCVSVRDATVMVLLHSEECVPRTTYRVNRVVQPV